ERRLRSFLSLLTPLHSLLAFRSGQLAVAVLVLLAGAAGAGFVAPDLGAIVLRRLQRKPHATRTGRYLARLAEGAGRSAATGSQHLLLQTLGHALLFGLHRSDFLLAANADAGEHLHHFGLDPREHVGEQHERLALERLFRVLLGVTHQVDALAQVIHAGKMVLPGVVDHGQHHVFFQLTHGFGADLRLLDPEQRGHLLTHVPEDHLGVDFVLLFHPVPDVGRQPELARQLPVKSRQIPLFVDAFGGHVGPYHGLHHVIANVGDGGRDLLAFKQFVALAIDHLALVVGDVVEFQQVFADVEVVLLDIALRLLDLPADHAILQRVVVLHAEALHPAHQAFAAEDTQQVVFQRQVEARGTRVALAAGTTAQLVVGTPGLVPLGADDVQATGRQHLLVQLLPLRLDAGAVDFAGAFRQRRQCDFQAATEHDIGTAAGHVGGDGDLAGRAGLGHDVRLALMLLGVQHFVHHASLVQQAGEQFGYFDRGGADQYRLSALVAILDVLDHRVVLRRLRQEDHVRVVLADHRLVGGDHHHLQAVDALELERLGVGRTGHAGQLLVHAEQVLERHRCQRLVLALDRHALLRLDRLVQAIGPAPAGQGTPGELVNDDHL